MAYRDKSGNGRGWAFIIAVVVLTTLAFLGLLCVCAKGASAGEQRAYLDAIRMVESTGNDRAVGDGGRSCGPFQCGRAAWKDACEFGGVSWDYDCWVWDRARSERVFMWYTRRLGARAWEERARCWNSGPEWRKKYRLTNGYWRRVKAGMRSKRCQ